MEDISLSTCNVLYNHSEQFFFKLLFHLSL